MGLRWSSLASVGTGERFGQDETGDDEGEDDDDKKDDDNIDEGDHDNHDDDDGDQKWDANDHLVPLGGRQLKRDWELWQHGLVGLVHLTGLLSCIFKIGGLQHHHFHHQAFSSLATPLISSETTDYRTKLSFCIFKI